MKDLRLETKCIQAGYVPTNGQSRLLPIVQSTTFKYDSSEEMGLYTFAESHQRLGSKENLCAGRRYSGNADFFRSGGELLCCV